MPDHLSVEEYLRRTEKPNCDYIDGVLRPKPLPGWWHAVVQGRVAMLVKEVPAGAALTAEGISISLADVFSVV